MLLAGCGERRIDLNEHVALARRYVRAFDQHRWNAVCRLGPRHGADGFSGSSGCAARMGKLFAHASMRYDGAILGTFATTDRLSPRQPSPPRAKAPYRFFAVKIRGQLRELVVIADGSGESVYLYDDCIADISRTGGPGNCR